jgi:hypothetical protein
MPALHNSYAYRFDNFLEETRNLINKSKASLYFHIIFSKEKTWENLKSLMAAYSQDGRRHWDVTLSRTQQDDFYILQFISKYDEAEQHSFYWKVMDEGKKVTILSFSLEKFRFIKSCLNSFVDFANMDFPWLGSVFLENLDEFIRSTFGADARVEFNKLIYDLEPIGGRGKSQANLAFSPISKKEVLSQKQKEYEERNKFFYIRWMKARVFWRDVAFVFSISDESQILLEKGDLIRFLEIINALKNIAALHRGFAEKHLLMDITEKQVEEGKKIDVRRIKELQVLKLDINNPMTNNWYENFTSLFTAPFKSDENIMSFVLMKGNPYFLAHVVDLEKGGSGVYLSATENSIRISPSGQETNVATVLKIIKAVQKYVDPNITIAGA